MRRAIWAATFVALSTPNFAAAEEVAQVCEDAIAIARIYSEALDEIQRDIAAMRATFELAAAVKNTGEWNAASVLFAEASTEWKTRVDEAVHLANERLSEIDKNCGS